MPKAEVREIELAGPAHLRADGGDQRRLRLGRTAAPGRTSRSWLVGREAETPPAKMGPFRLDLGPRIYRSVGQRQHELATAGLGRQPANASSSTE